MEIVGSCDEQEKLYKKPKGILVEGLEVSGGWMLVVVGYC
jgi:hypothetical protein